MMGRMLGRRGLLGRKGSAGAGEVPGAGGAGVEGREIPVVYDGPDLDEVAGLTGLSREQVIERHAAASTWSAGWASPPASAT